MWLVVLAALRTVSSKRLAFQHTADKQSSEILHYERWDKPNVLYSSRFCRTCAKPNSSTGTQLVFQLIRTSARITGHGRLPTSEQAMKKQLPLSRQAIFHQKKTAPGLGLLAVQISLSSGRWAFASGAVFTLWFSPPAHQNKLVCTPLTGRSLNHRPKHVWSSNSTLLAASWRLGTGSCWTNARDPGFKRQQNRFTAALFRNWEWPKLFGAQNFKRFLATTS